MILKPPFVMPSTPGSGLKVLIEEARRRHEDTRPDMLRTLVSLYVREQQHSPAEQTRFATLARRLIDAVEVPAAAKWVREIAPRADMPRELVLHLAQGPLALAGPVLRQSPVLTDDDLVTIARTASEEHFAAVSARREVSSALAKQLAQFIHQTSEGATEATDELTSPAIGTEISGTDTVLSSAPPITDPAFERLETALTALARMQTETAPDKPVNAAVPAVAVPEAPAEASSQSEPDAKAEVEAEAPALDDTGSELSSEPTPTAVPDYFTASPEERTTMVARLLTLPPLPLAERPAAASDGFTDTLLEAARSGEPAAIAALLEPALGISAENAARVVADGTGQAFAVAARALGLSFAILSRVLFRLHPATGRSASEMTRLAQIFDMMPVASAQHLVASWRSGRRAIRERAEDVPSMRSFGTTRPAPHAHSETTEGRQHG
jgi:uncharacterized protein (DUF2336 family)